MQKANSFVAVGFFFNGLFSILHALLHIKRDIEQPYFLQQIIKAFIGV